MIEVDHFITKEKTMIPLAGPANKQGRMVADNIYGANKEYKGSMGTSVAKVFDLTVAATGLNEKTLKAKGLKKNEDYYAFIISQKSHAGYYPLATPMFLKLLFNAQKEILGAQIVGQDNVDKRNSKHIPLGQLRKRLGELNEYKDQEIVIYCAIGVRSYNAARILMGHGFTKVSVLEGGSSFYKSMMHKPTIHTNQDIPSNNCGCDTKDIQILDCCGLQCPGPIMKVNETLKEMKPGETLKVSATDMGFARDVENWCARTGNTFISKERDGKQNIVTIQKGNNETKEKETITSLPQGKTIIVFDGDMDKAMASFIIANGAAAMGRPVTMFFTFWGLNILRKKEKVKVKKSFIESMFGKMMPRGVDQLKLSNMNMMGMGSKMMKYVMKSKNVASLDQLIEDAKRNGVKLVACTMSMDVMGIKEEELIDGVELAGVASYLADAENSNVNLFI